MRSLSLLAGAGALALLLGACSAAPSASPSAAAPAASPTLPASPVEGVVVAVDATSLSDVRGFSLRLADGTTVAFRLGRLENPTEFAPGHLKEHQATSSVVRVFFAAGPDGPVVYRLEDVSAASPAAT